MSAPTRGIDHVGLTVPDIDEATRFFQDALGAELLYDTLPDSLSGPEIEQALGVPGGTVLIKARMLRLGAGPSIELFSYGSVEQREPVRASDLGIQHFALYVDDIDDAAARITKFGAVLLTEPSPLPGAEEGPGNRWAYSRLPWGGLMELVTTPSPQAYEAHTPLRRWHPSPEE